MVAERGDHDTPPHQPPHPPFSTTQHPMDNWHSLVVLGAAFLSQTIMFGFVLSFGIYFVTLLEHFDTTRREVAIVGSLCYGTSMAAAPAASVLFRRYGCRRVVMLGGCLTSLGLLLSYFATTLVHLYVTYGIIVGIGFGFVFTPSVGIQADYFLKYRYFATAFVSVGSAAGTFLFSPIFLWLIERYTWRGSMLINAGITLQLLVLGNLLVSRRVDSHLPWRSILETQLLRNPIFLLLCLDCILWGGAVFSMFSMVNNLAISHGLTKSDSAFIVSAMGIGNMAGRICSSLIGQCRGTDHVMFYSVSTLIFSSCILAITLARSFASFVVIGCIFGAFFGAMLAQLPAVIMNLVGVGCLVNGIGYVMFVLGVSSIFLPIFGVWLSDYTGRADAAFYFAGGCGMLGALVCFCMWACHRRINRGKDISEPLVLIDTKYHNDGGNIESALISNQRQNSFDTCNDKTIRIEPNRTPCEHDDVDERTNGYAPSESNLLHRRPPLASLESLTPTLVINS